MGLVVVILTASVNGYDLIADPVGWVLVLVGLSSLGVPQHGTLQTLATLSLVVSLPLWAEPARDVIRPGRQSDQNV